MTFHVPVLLKRFSSPAFATVVILGLSIYLITALDWHGVARVLADADWRWVAAALVFAGVSYLVEAYAYALINRSFGIRLPIRDLIEIGMVSSTMIASVGGFVGHGIRIILLSRRNVRRSEGMAPSPFHSYFESLAFFLFIPGGLTYIVLTHPLERYVAATITVGAVVFGIAFPSPQ